MLLSSLDILLHIVLCCVVHPSLSLSKRFQSKKLLCMKSKGRDDFLLSTSDCSMMICRKQAAPKQRASAWRAVFTVEAARDELVCNHQQPDVWLDSALGLCPLLNIVI